MTIVGPTEHELQARERFEGAVVDLPTPKRRVAKVQDIDFRRPTKFPREVVRRLEHQHDSFCRTASSGLSAELRTSFELAVAGSEQLPWGTAAAEAPQDALLCLLAVEPYDTQVALMLELPLALGLVDRLLGSGGKPRDPVPAALTDLEAAVLRRALASLVTPLSATWHDLGDVRFELTSVQTSPTSVQLVSPSEPVLVLVFEARLDGLVSPISFYVPFRAVAPIVEQLDRRHFDSERADPGTQGRVRAAMAAVDVEVRAEVGSIDLPLRDVLALAVGDVIRMRRPVERGVLLRAGDVATHLAQPGRSGNLRAVQISTPWRPE